MSHRGDQRHSFFAGDRPEEQSPTLPAAIEQGLTIRQATADDADAIAAFNATIHQWPDPADGNPELVAWTRDLLGGQHPTTGPADWLLIEEGRSGQIVSALGLISQTWTYDGIAFGVGRPELIGTNPDYRRQGLVRRLLTVAHHWSAERGQLLQGITGIPWYYRQFGYEPALALDGGRIVSLTQLPALASGTPEPYQLRPAGAGDLQFIADTYAAGLARYRIMVQRDLTVWRHEVAGHSHGSIAARDWSIITRASDGVPVGILSTYPFLHSGTQVVVEIFELRPGESWLAIAPSVLRGLRRLGESLAATANEHRSGMERQQPATIVFLHGSRHPLYTTLPALFQQSRAPYAWYIRVPDLPAFLQRIAPALEERLARSPAVGYSGVLRLSFYREGIQLTFEQGSLLAVVPWQPEVGAEGDAGFPDRTFLQLLLGYRSLDELRYAFADCWSSGEATALLQILFPPASAHAWGVG